MYMHNYILCDESIELGVKVAVPILMHIMRQPGQLVELELAKEGGGGGGGGARPRARLITDHESHQMLIQHGVCGAYPQENSIYH